MAKILYLTDSFDVGGAERQLSLLLKYLPCSWETRVISFDDGPFHQVFEDQMISSAVFQRHRRFDLIPVYQLYEEILRYKPDIVHPWGGFSVAIAAPICKILRILMIDGSIRTGGSSRYSWRRKITFSLSDHVVANSAAGLSSFEIPAHKGTVIYNAINPERLKLLNQKPKEENSVFTVTMTGRISPFKDFTTFFEGARRLNQQQPGAWKFVAIGAGEGKNRSRFIKLAEDLVESGIVEFPYAGLEVLPFLKEANIGVLLSAACFKEGFSNSIMEYMAAELPVICSDSGGNRELVVDGETGFVIPAENVDIFIEKLLYLRDNPEISERMGKAGHERLMAMCSMERMISDYETLYTRLLAKGK